MREKQSMMISSIQSNNCKLLDKEIIPQKISKITNENFFLIILLFSTNTSS